MFTNFQFLHDINSKLGLCIMCGYIHITIGDWGVSQWGNWDRPLGDRLGIGIRLGRWLEFVIGQRIPCWISSIHQFPFPPLSTHSGGTSFHPIPPMRSTHFIVTTTSFVPISTHFHPWWLPMHPCMHFHSPTPISTHFSTPPKVLGADPFPLLGSDRLADKSPLLSPKKNPHQHEKPKWWSPRTTIF